MSAKITSNHGNYATYFTGEYRTTKTDVKTGNAVDAGYDLHFAGYFDWDKKTVQIGFGDYRMAKFTMMGGEVEFRNDGKYDAPNNINARNYDALKRLPKGVLKDVMGLLLPKA